MRFTSCPMDRPPIQRQEQPVAGNSSWLFCHEIMLLSSCVVQRQASFHSRGRKPRPHCGSPNSPVGRGTFARKANATDLEAVAFHLLLIIKLVGYWSLPSVRSAAA